MARSQRRFDIVGEGSLTFWLWRLTRTRNSHAWQDKSVPDIVDDVFAAYAPKAQWQK